MNYNMTEIIALRLVQKSNQALIVYYLFSQYRALSRCLFHFVRFKVIFTRPNCTKTLLLELQHLIVSSLFYINYIFVSFIVAFLHDYRQGMVYLHRNIKSS